MNKSVQTTLHVHMPHVQYNWCHYNTLCAHNTTVSAVIKANAYACGMIPVAQSLYAVGCRHFWVATLQEGIALRQGLYDKGICDTSVQIMVLEGVFDSAPYVDYTLIGVINHESQCVHLQSVPCWIHIDTGMNRLGIHHTRATDLILQHIHTRMDYNIVGYMTHLLQAEVAHSPTHQHQYNNLQTAIATLPPKKVSICNSDGVFLGHKYHADMVRIGVGLYGINTHAHGLKPAVTCTAPILNITHISAGETVGYNATYTADKNMTVATLGAGYKDGIGTPYSNGTVVYYDTIACPVIGRVSMDSLCIDISHVKNPQLGKAITLFNDVQTVHDISKKTGFPPHAVLCTIGERVKKVYTGMQTVT